MTDWDGFDRNLARKLTRHTRLASRRMFLSRLSRGIFGAAGIVIATKVELFEITKSQADSASLNLAAPPANVVAPPNPNPLPWNWCGLHGHVCSATCTAPGGYTSQGYGWVQCCQNPADSKWYCCTYSDLCSTTPPSPKDVAGCTGTTPCGPMWCAQPSSGARGYYICTNISCGNAGSGTDSGCTGGCNPTQFGGDRCDQENC